MGQHWYTRDGKPKYTIIGANGQERDTTLRDARKYGLVPSVTTVLDVIDKPQLDNWKVKQGILAALTLPRMPGETDDAFIARVLGDSQQQAKTAAEEGTRIHDAIEASFGGKFVSRAYEKHVAGVHAELKRLFPDVEDWVSEKSFAHPLGFGGKIDLHSPSTGIVVDYKGKDIAPGDDKKLGYDQNWQLGAYHNGIGLQRSRCANLFVSRTHPGHVVSHIWEPGDVVEGYYVFVAALQLWCQLKGYQSRFDRG